MEIKHKGRVVDLPLVVSVDIETYAVINEYLKAQERVKDLSTEATEKQNAFLAKGKVALEGLEGEEKKIAEQALQVEFEKVLSDIKKNNIIVNDTVIDATLKLSKQLSDTVEGWADFVKGFSIQDFTFVYTYWLNKPQTEIETAAYKKDAQAFLAQNSLSDIFGKSSA